MTTKYPILGIDVSKAKLDLCLLLADGEQRTVMVRNTPAGHQHMLDWLQKHAGTHDALTTCLEATSVYSAAVALRLFECGATVYLANPSAVHAFMHAQLRRTKTDKADAGSIAAFVQAMARSLRPWKPMSADYAELQDLVRHLYSLTRSRAKVKNQIEKAGYISSAAKRFIEGSLRTSLRHYDRRIRALRTAITACVQRSTLMTDRLQRLTSAPGVGPMTALMFMAEIPDVQQFAHAKQLAAFAGITPRIRHSGTHRPESQPISKIGSNRLRQALYMAAMTAKRYNHRLIPFAERLNAKGKKPQVVTIAVARKLVHQLYAIDKNQCVYDPAYQKCQSHAGTN